MGVPINDDRLRRAARSLGLNPDDVELRDLYRVNDEARRLDGLPKSDGTVIGYDAPLAVVSVAPVAALPEPVGRSQVLQEAPVPVLVTHVGPPVAPAEVAAMRDVYALPPAVKGGVEGSSPVAKAILGAAIAGAASYAGEAVYEAKQEGRLDFESQARDIGGLPLARAEEQYNYGRFLGAFLDGPGGETVSEASARLKESMDRSRALEEAQPPPSGFQNPLGDILGGLSLGLAGASIALSGIGHVAGVDTAKDLAEEFRRPVEKILPGAKRPTGEQYGPPDLLFSAPKITKESLRGVTPPGKPVSGEESGASEQRNNESLHVMPTIPATFEPSAKGSGSPLDVIERRALLESVAPPSGIPVVGDRLRAAASGLGLNPDGVSVADLPLINAEARRLDGGSPMLGIPNATPLGAVSKATEYVKANPGTTAAVLGGATAVLGGGAALAVASRRKKAKKKAKKKAPVRKSASAKRAKARRATKKSGSKRRREDRSGVTRSKYKGQKVYRTKNGRPYVIRKSGPMKGMAKFIPQ